MSEPTFGVGQNSGTRMEVLSRIIRTLRQDEVHVLEIGSYEGASALAMSHTIGELKNGGSITCVDPWRPYHTPEQESMGEPYRLMNEDLRDGATFKRFVENIKFAHGKCPIDYKVGTIAQVYGDFFGLDGIEKQFDLVFIDGDHRASAVRVDIALGKKLVGAVGFLCGDDLEHQISPANYNEAKANCETDYHNTYHPGVSLAVWEEFGIVWACGGIWAVRSDGHGSWLTTNPGVDE